MELVVLDEGFRAVAIIDSYKSLVWSDRYNEYGEFELYLRMDNGLLDFLKEDYYLWRKDSEKVMIIESLAIDSDVEEGNFLAVKGRSLEAILERRIIWGQKIVNGGVQSIIHGFLNECIINPDMAERRIDNFVFVQSKDVRITRLEANVQYNGDNLYEVIKGLCAANKLGFKIVLDAENRFSFSLYMGEDRSYAQESNPYVVFSPKYENIINSNFYSSKAELKNVVFVAGEGEGAKRKRAIVYEGAVPQGLARREIFTDAGDVSSTTDGEELTAVEYQAQLENRGREVLSECGVRTAFEGEVETTRLFRYGEDFFLGDVVQITNEYGHEAAAYISEVVTSQDEEGLRVYPTFQIADKEG
jgi:hypothetical protein